MAGRNISDKSAAITAATANGYVTIASVAGWYVGARGNIEKAGLTSREVIITEINTTANTMGIRFVREPGTGPSYGRNDVSAYNGGTIYQHAQFIFNPNDLPLS